MDATLGPERVLNLLVCAPLGLARQAAGAVPGALVTLVARSCAHISAAPATVRAAQAMGRMAVTFGGRQLRREVDSRLAGVRRSVEGLAGGAPAGVTTDRPAPGPAPAPPAPARPAPAPRKATARGPAAGGGTPPAGAGLAIPEYDGLSASQVVSRLSGLTAAELESVRRYEAANRARKTVLAAVDRLARS